MGRDLDGARAACTGNAPFSVPVRSKSDADLVSVDVVVRGFHSLLFHSFLGLAFAP